MQNLNLGMNVSMKKCEKSIWSIIWGIQLQSLDDPAYTDEHTLLVQLIHTFGKVGPNAEPKFRDECKYDAMWKVNLVDPSNEMSSS